MQSFPFALLPGVFPSKMKPITADGNCLFRCFSFFLTGDENECFTALRSMICDHICSVPFIREHFLFHSNSSVCSYSWHDYLENEQMVNNGVYGGDIEIVTFCHLFQIRIAVFVESPASDKWFIYDRYVPRDAPTFFLFHKINHFEPIIDVCISSSNMTKFSQCTESPFSENSKPLIKSLKRPLDTLSVSTGRQNKSLLLQQPFSPSREFGKQNANHQEINFSSFYPKHFNLESFKLGKVQENFNVDFVLKSERRRFFQCFQGNPCDCCKRVSTIWYPLIFTQINSSDLISKLKFRKYGVRMAGSNRVVCQTCLSYLTEKKPLWRNAWPSVIYSLCFNTKLDTFRCFFYKLPKQLQASWFYQRLLFRERHSVSPIFVDVTRDICEFKRLIGTYQAIDYKTCMNDYALPTVKCFCGSSEFIEEVGKIDLHHLLNYIDNSFMSFGASWRKKIRCIRSDYLDEFPKWLPFKCAPSIIVGSDGLSIASCSSHKSGSSDNMVHVMRNPVVGNLSHNFADRLAPLASSIRGATTTKIGEFSNTFFLSKSVGNRKGVGSTTVHHNRNLAVKSDFILPGIENLFLGNRIDIKETLNSVADEFHFDLEKVGHFQCQLFDPKPATLLQSLKSASYIPISLVNTIKSLIDKQPLENEDESSKIYYKLDPLVCDPNRPNLTQPAKSVFKNHYFLALLISIINNLFEVFQYALIEESTLAKKIVTICKNLRENNLPTVLDDLMKTLNYDKRITFKEFWKQIAKMLNWHFVEGANFFENHSEKNIIIFASNRNHEIEFNLEMRRNFQLRFNEISPGLDKFNLAYFKYNPQEDTTIYNSKKSCTKCIANVFNDYLIRKSRLYLFVKVSQVPPGILSLVSGQSDVSCPKHKLFLCKDYITTKYFCLFEDCGSKSKWRCPQSECSICLCKRHFEFVQKNPTSVCLLRDQSYEFELENFSDNQTNSFVELDNEDSDSNDHEDHFLFSAPSLVCNETDTHLDTDSSAVPFDVETGFTDEQKHLPLHLILNVFMAVLKRKNSVIEGNLKYKRFIQSFVAKFRGASISLLQLEALLFPSIFFKQFADGSSPGAIPFFLFTSENICKKYGFESLLNHFRTRITDISLATSGSHRYIQFATDCLINMQLRKTHSQEFFRRGIQSLKLNGRNSRTFFRELNFEQNDTEHCVRQLSAAMRDEVVTFFLTLTCNQKHHPGVAPLIHAIKNFYQNCSDEVKYEAINAFMVTLVRCWSRSVRYLINLITYSKENLLGKVFKIWGRAEFQTTAGNLPHYHVLIWSEKGSYDPQDLIQCSEKNILNAFQNLFNHEVKSFHSKQDMMKKYENCVRIHSHSCEKSKYRCMKRKDLDGNKICRTPPQPQSNNHWKLEIRQQYPFEVVKYLTELGLAEFSTNGDFKVFPPLNCDKWMYAASTGEHILPTNVRLFNITESSVNLLMCTGQFSCNYLTRYAVKNEEHSECKISSGADGKTFRLRDEGIKNKSLANVKFLLELDKKTERKQEHISCQKLAITESVFWLLGEPYIFTNMQFISVQNVPMEMRYVGACQEKREHSGLNILNFRDFVDDLPAFRKYTNSQRIILNDYKTYNESLDAMSSFNLRPPELLCISNVEIYFRFFEFSKVNFETSELVSRFASGTNVPLINCTGGKVKIRKLAINGLSSFLSNQLIPIDDLDIARRDWLKSVIDDPVLNEYISFDSESSLLPEIVFIFLSPKDPLTFLVGFLLRFGYYHTELDLFQSNDLLDSFVCAQLLESIDNYSITHVNDLVTRYIMKDLRFQPGGVLQFSSKILMAKNAFSRLLRLDYLEVFHCPVVLLQEMHDATKKDVDSFIRGTQQSMKERTNELRLPNIPSNSDDGHSYWEPEFLIGENQNLESFLEQQTVLRKIIDAINNKFGSNNHRKINHQLILGYLP